MSNPTEDQKKQCDHSIWTAWSYVATPASLYWCGNLWRQPGRPGAMMPDIVAPPELKSTCVGKSKDARGAGIPAIEHAELRGWIRCSVSSNPIRPVTTGQGESHFDFEPDLDWKPDPSPAPAVLGQTLTPVNRFEQVASLLTPHNSADDHSGRFRVEVNHWVPSRVCGVGKNDVEMTNYNVMVPCPQFLSTRPAGWDHWLPGPPPAAFAPFDVANPPHTSDLPPRQFQCDDYVRIVATVWEDMPHNTPGDQFDDVAVRIFSQQSSNCWIQNGSSTADRGWAELHPVDFMARIPQPLLSNGKIKTTNGVKFLSACASSGLFSGRGSGDALMLAPEEPRPSPGAHLLVDEFVVNAFTLPGSILPPFGDKAHRVSVFDPAGQALVHVLVNSQAGLGGRGTFWAAYRAHW